MAILSRSFDVSFGCVFMSPAMYRLALSFPSMQVSMHPLVRSCIASFGTSSKIMMYSDVGRLEMRILTWGSLTRLLINV